MLSRDAGLVPVHIGQPEPGSEDERRLPTELERASARGAARGLLRVPGNLNWSDHGVEPRWLGAETSDCAFAIQPGNFGGRGAEERQRFLAGAAQRGEQALMLSIVGDVAAADVQARSHSATVAYVADLFTSVNGRRLPTLIRPTVAPDLTSADRDLAHVLLDRPPDAPWWALSLSGATTYRGDGFGGPTQYAAKGRLEPILVDSLGAPLAAAWVSPEGEQRWYVVPDGLDWDSLLNWLMGSALPQLAPEALRRVRTERSMDHDLPTLSVDQRQALQAAYNHFRRTRGPPWPSSGILRPCRRSRRFNARSRAPIGKKCPNL